MVYVRECRGYLTPTSSMPQPPGEPDQRSRCELKRHLSFCLFFVIFGLLFTIKEKFGYDKKNKNGSGFGLRSPV